MYRNGLSPWWRLGEIIRNSGLDSNYLFAPLYGLGDRASFYAYLDAFERRVGRAVTILSLSGESDPVAELFPSLVPKIRVVPKEHVVAPLDLAHWVYGNPKPEIGRIFFTWHWAYGDGSAAVDWERRSDQEAHCTHKNLVKEILGLPASAPLGALRPEVCSPASGLRSSRVMLCPASKTIKGPPDSWWIALASSLRSRGLEPVFNVSLAASANSGVKSAVATYDRFTRFDAPIGTFLREVVNYRGVVSARSGLCELLALAGATPYAIVTQQPVAPFWRLGDGFGRAPEATIQIGDQAAENMLGEILECWSA